VRDANLFRRCAWVLASLGAACSFTDLDELAGSDGSTLDASSDAAGGSVGSGGSGGATGGVAGDAPDADAGAAGNAGTAGGSATCPGGHLPLADDFNDGVIATEWSVWPGDGINILEAQGRLTMVFPPTSIQDSWAGIGSEQKYDFTECSTFIRLVGVPQAPETYCSFAVQLSAGNSIHFSIYPSSLHATVRKDGISIVVETAPFDPSLHAWLRLRHSGERVFWETSSNGQTWNEFGSLQKPFDVTSLMVIIGVGANFVEPTAGVNASFDNFDVAP
jgi:hypothetical protein